MLPTISAMLLLTARRPTECFDRVRQLRNRWSFEEMTDWNVNFEQVAYSRFQLEYEQRVSAQLEEITHPSNPFGSQQARKYLRQTLFDLVLRCGEIFGISSAGLFRRRQ